MKMKTKHERRRERLPVGAAKLSSEERQAQLTGFEKFDEAAARK